jgi:hypothetical protein
MFQDGGQWYVTMELVRGRDFLSYVAGSDGLDEGGWRCDEHRLRDAVGQLAEGIHALHEAGLVHRDIKPSNVLVTPAGRVVLLDFGFVLDTQLSTTQSSTVVGTPRYMAPEQAVTGDVTAAADWYSLGVMLYEALTGKPPHQTGGGHVLKLLMDKQRVEPPSPRAAVPGTPPDLDALCMSLLRIDPEVRPDGRAVLRQLGITGRTRSVTASLSTGSILSSFVGREDELRSLRGVYDAMRDGGTSIAVVEGISGVGKSALVRKFVGTVVAEGAVGLSGRCLEREAVPYRGFDGVIDSLARYLRSLDEVRASALVPQHADALQRLFPVLGAVPAIAQAPSRRGLSNEPHELRARAFGALRELLFRLGQRSPLVVTIDDWQWVDADSVTLAREVFRHRDAPEALLLLTVASPVTDEVRARIDLGIEDVHAIEVAPLDAGRAGDLTAILLATLAPGLEVDRDAIVRESGGNPLHISELVRYVAGRANQGDPISLDQAVSARVGALAPEALQVLLALAVLGEPVPPTVVRELARLEATEFQRIVATLRLGNLVRASANQSTLELNNELVRTAVLARLPAQGQRRWHKAAALAVETSGLARDRPELLVHHLEASDQPEKAAAMALLAADNATKVAAFDRAAGFLRTVIRLSEPFATDEDTNAALDLRALRIRLGEALANAGRGGEAGEQFMLAAEGAEPELQLDCQSRAADQFLRSGHVERGIEVLHDLLAAVGVRMPGSTAAALRSVVLQRAWLRLRGLRWRERRAGQIAPETLARLDVLKTASIGLSLVDVVRGADFNARWLSLAMRTGERHRLGVALGAETIHVASQGGFRRAALLADHVARIAEGADDPLLRAWHATGLAAIAYFSCQLDRATAGLEEAEQHLSLVTGSAWELASVRIMRTWVLRHSGHWRELGSRFSDFRADAERRGDRFAHATLLRLCSVLRLAEDDPAGARAMVEEGRWASDRQGFHLQHWYELEARGEIAIYEGAVAEAWPALDRMFETLRGSVLTRVITVRMLSVWLQGRLALRHRPPGEGTSSWSRRIRGIVRTLDGIGDPRGRVGARLIEASVARAERRDGDAIAHLRRAAEEAEASGLELHARAAQRRLGELIGGDRGRELVARAEAWMRREGIHAPDRMTALFVPLVDPGPA